MSGVYASTEAGIAGLLLFLFLFAVAVFWVLRPSAKTMFEKFGEIPLKDE